MFVEACVGAIMFVTCYVDPVLSMQHDNMSYHSESESVVSETLCEHQQCQVEFADDKSDGSDYVRDTVPLLTMLQLLVILACVAVYRSLLRCRQTLSKCFVFATQWLMQVIVYVCQIVPCGFV